MLVDHVVQDVVPALLDERLPVVAGDGPVVLARGLEERGEVGALLDVQLLGVLAVVRLRRGLDPVGAAAVVTGVDVPGEDLALASLLVDLQRDDQLFELPGDRLVGVEVVVLDVLLGDGRATLLALAGNGVDQSAGGALEVDAVIVVEGLVLGGHEGPLDVLGDLCEADDLPVDLSRAGQQCAVGVLVDVGLELGLCVAFRHLHDHVEHGERAHSQQADAQSGAQ